MFVTFTSCLLALRLLVKKKTQFLFQPSIFNTRTCTFDLIEITWTGLIHCARQIYTLHRHNSHFPSPLTLWNSLSPGGSVL